MKLALRRSSFGFTLAEMMVSIGIGVVGNQLFDRSAKELFRRRSLQALSSRRCLVAG